VLDKSFSKAGEELETASLELENVLEKLGDRRDQ
jgi:hypothetical protein